MAWPFSHGPEGPVKWGPFFSTLIEKKLWPAGGIDDTAQKEAIARLDLTMKENKRKAKASRTEKQANGH